jgi:MoxR-like ATPase
MKTKALENTKNVDINSLEDCQSCKPPTLIIDDIKWKYLYRSVIKGKTTLIIGPTGSGKTLAAHSIAKALKREDKFYYFNLGAMTDARCSLIGNTHFDKDTGTIFDESLFVKAIKTKNSIILLDELSRAHHDAVNILMTVLDELQRYLRIDEKKESDTVKVADGVTFIGTANIGNEYTATRVMDRALLNRFSVKIEMNPLSKEKEFDLMKERFNLTDENQLKTLNSIVEIAEHTRTQIKSEDPKVSNFLSTRSVVEMTDLLKDGFTLNEIAEAAIYPNFSNDGGVDSERVYMKQLVQKYLESPVEQSSPFFPDPDSPVQPPDHPF